MEGYSWSWVGKINFKIEATWTDLEDIMLTEICQTKTNEMVIFPKLTYRFNAISIKIPAGFFAEIDKLILKFVWKCKKPSLTKTIMKNKKTHASWFQNPIKQ